MALAPMEFSLIGSTISVTGLNCAAYITGSGNYIGLFIPMEVDTSKTYTVSISSGRAYMPDSMVEYNNTNFDTAYCSVTNSPIGLAVELKFRSTKTANRGATFVLTGTITAS